MELISEINGGFFINVEKNDFVKDGKTVVYFKAKLLDEKNNFHFVTVDKAVAEELMESQERIPMDYKLQLTEELRNGVTVLKKRLVAVL